MKTVKVTTDDRISIVDVDFDDFRSIQKAIGGHFETVRTQRMRDYFGTEIMMIVDEEGHLKQLPFNRLGSWFYGEDEHGCPIAGDFILAVPVYDSLTGLEDAEAVKKRMMRDFKFLKEEQTDEHNL